MPDRYFSYKPSYEGQMPSKRSPSGGMLYKITEKPKPSVKTKRRVYIIKGGRLGGWRGYDEDEAKRLHEKYGGQLRSHMATLISEGK